MNRALIVAALVAAACGGKGTQPTAPTTTAPGAQTAAGPAVPGPAADGGETEIKGIVESLPPATAPLTFRTNGRIVTTNASTSFIEEGIVRTFAELKIGTPVEVKGTVAGGTFTATRVEIEEDEAEQPKPGPVPAPAPGPGPSPGPTPKPEPREAEFTGAISGLTGSASSFQFSVGGRLVKGDGTTAINGESNAAKSFADLKNGEVVEVKGMERDGFVQATRIHLEDDEDEAGPGEDDDDEVEVEGTLGAVSGTCPAIASSVGSTRFTTSASTRFDDAACTAFRAGDRVEVRGTKKADGSIAATRLKRK